MPTIATARWQLSLTTARICGLGAYHQALSRATAYAKTALRVLTSRRRRSRQAMFERRAAVLPRPARLYATPYRLHCPPGLDSSSPPRLLNPNRSTTARGVGRKNGGFGPGCALGSASQRRGELRSRRTLRCGAVVAILKSTAATKSANAAAARGHGKRDALRDLEGLLECGLLECGGCAGCRFRVAKRAWRCAQSQSARHTANGISPSRDPT